MLRLDRVVVVLDACVLAPMPLCDTLLRLADDPGFFIPKWSSDILRELQSTLLKFDYTQEQVDRRIRAMRAAFEDAMVEGYECLVPSMTNHAKDRHVPAAAVRAGAHAIVSDNVRHFPESALKPYSLECLSSDDFLVHQYHLEPDMLVEKLEMQLASS